MPCRPRRRRYCPRLGDCSACAYESNVCTCGRVDVCTLRCAAMLGRLLLFASHRSFAVPSACLLACGNGGGQTKHVRGTSLQAQQGEVRLQIRYGTLLQGCVWKDSIDSHRANSTGLAVFHARREYRGYYRLLSQDSRDPVVGNRECGFRCFVCCSTLVQ